MKHIFLFCIAYLLYLSNVLAGSSAVPENQVVIIENDWPPYYFGSNSQISGFAKDLLTICVPRSGYTPDFQFYPVKRMYYFLQKGEIDVALFSYKKKRENMVHYGKEPLFTSSYRPIVRSDSNIDIQKIQDFDTLRLGHLAGLKYSPEFFEYVKKRQSDGTIITTSVGESNLKMLLQNIIDVYVGTEDTVLWRAHKIGVGDKITVLDYDIKTSPYFVTVSKNSHRIGSPETFLESIDSCIIDLKKSGQFGQIAQKYGLNN